MTTSDIELRSGAEHPATEPHALNVAGRLNWLRAGVLGANDGIVSTAGLVVGVAGATAAREVIFTAGMAGLVAGAVSMALGEYVSVSTQRDSQRALLRQECQELRDTPEAELRELAGLYAAKGLSQQTARAVAEELNKRGVETPGGGRWHAVTVLRVRKRLQPRLGSTAKSGPRSPP